MKNFSFNQTQWLVSLLSASCVSVVSLLWKLSAVLLRRERREREGGVPRSSKPASLHCPGGKHQPLDQWTSELFTTQASKQRLQTSKQRMGPFYEATLALHQRKAISINLFLSGRMNSVFLFLVCVIDWSSESWNEGKMPSNDKGGWKRARVCGGGDVEAD